MRLHRIDENVSGDVAPLLAFLRELQRRHAVAIAVVHHARKGAGTLRAGQALRGSSEFHAWGDSNLYLRRDTDDRIALTVEHRAAALTEADKDRTCPIGRGFGPPTRRSREPEIPGPSTLDERITSALAEAASPLPFGELRSKCRVRAATLYERLAALTTSGRIVKAGNVRLSPRG